MRQFGADENLLGDRTEITLTKEEVECDCNSYGLIALGSLLSQLSSRHSPPLIQSECSLPFDVRLHCIVILMKMSLDAQFGDELLETTAASLSNHLAYLSPSEQQILMGLLTDVITDSALQYDLLDRLPIHPPVVASFRQSLAKEFLGIPSTGNLEVFLSYLRTSHPFTKIQRDMTNENTIQIKNAILIFDIAIASPNREHRPVVEDIIRELTNMHRRIVDRRAAFLARTETKMVIQRTWLRLDHALNGSKRNHMENLDDYF